MTCMCLTQKQYILQRWIEGLSVFAQSIAEKLFSAITKIKLIIFSFS